MEENYQEEVIGEAKKVTISAETKSSVVGSTSKMVLMTTEVLPVDKHTNHRMPTRGVYEIQSNVLFGILGHQLMDDVNQTS